MLRAPAAVLCFALLIGVSAAAGDIVKPRIIDGTNVPASQFPTVGQVGDGLYGIDSFYCSGTLIGSRFVMTAAHCVCDSDGIPLIPPTLGRFKLGGTIYKTKNITVHPTYRGDLSFLKEGDFDLAIFELDADVPNVTPTPLYRSAPVVNQILILAGYGLVGEGDLGVTDASVEPPDGTIEFGPTPIDQVTATFVRWVFQDKAPPNKEANTSPGDSGGPAFIEENGVLKLAAVTSGGTSFTAAFGDFSFDTRIDPQATWIDRILAGQSGNDDFFNATPLYGAPVSAKAISNGATKEIGEPLHGGNAGGASLWWRWTASVSGSVTVTTANSNFATNIGVYSGGAVSALNVVTSNGNSVTFLAQAAKTYYIAVDGQNGATGNVVLALTQVGKADIQIQSIEILPEFALPGDDVFFIISLYNAGTADAFVPISFWSDLDDEPKIDTFPEGVGYADLPAGGKDFLFFSVTAPLKEKMTARAYADAYIGVSTIPETDETNNTAKAEWSVGIAIANDDFKNALKLPSGDTFITGTNVGATEEPGEPDHASRPGGNSVWYSWTANASGPVFISTDGSTFDTVVGIYTGTAVNALTQVAANDDYLGDVTANVTFNAQAGVTYYFAIDGVNESQAGSFVLDLTAPSAEDLLVKKMQFKFSFTKAKKDSFAMQGAFDLPFDFESPALTPVTVVVGDFVRAYQLTQKGQSVDKQFKLSPNVKSFTAKFALNVKNETLLPTFAKLGFTDDNVDAKPITVPVIVALGTDSFQALVPVTYKAKKGKTGSAK